MKFKYILITVGSMLLLIGLMSFSGSRGGGIVYRTGSIVTAVIGIGALLTGIFWKKQ